MLRTLGTSRSVVLLLSAFLLTEVILFLLVASVDARAAAATVVRLAVPLVILLGIWTHSHFIRYLGAAYLAFVAALILWMLFATDKVVVGVAWFLMLIPAALALLTSLLLVFSKTFAAEFAQARKVQPVYKQRLRWVAVAAILAAVGVATLRDIGRLILLFSAKA